MALLTGSLEAVIQRQLFLGASTEAAVSAGVELGTNVNAAISTASSAGAGLDAISKASPLGTCGMQAFVGGVVVNDLYSVTAGGHALRGARAVGGGRAAVGLSGE